MKAAYAIELHILRNIDSKSLEIRNVDVLGQMKKIVKEEPLSKFIFISIRLEENT